MHIAVTSYREATLSDLFRLGLSFRNCQQTGIWPSLGTMNGFLNNGEDDGEHETVLNWDGFTASAGEYLKAVGEIMQRQKYTVMHGCTDHWADWFSDLAKGKWSQRVS